eukprot:COSAG01_NODE_1853_length_9060_cov_13.741576_6_plen_90_part_00
MGTARFGHTMVALPATTSGLGGSGGESFLRVDCVAVPEAMRARRPNKTAVWRRRRRRWPAACLRRLRHLQQLALAPPRGPEGESEPASR